MLNKKSKKRLMASLIAILLVVTAAVPANVWAAEPVTTKTDYGESASIGDDRVIFYYAEYFTVGMTLTVEGSRYSLYAITESTLFGDAGEMNYAWGGPWPEGGRLNGNPIKAVEAVASTANKADRLVMLVNGQPIAIWEPGAKAPTFYPPPVVVEPGSPLAGFSDASGISSWALSYFERLVQEKIVTGYEDGSLRPNGNVTRAEFTKMIVAALGIPPGGEAKSFPVDVKAGDWYKTPVDIASAHDIVKGVSAVAFNPNSYISRQDLAAIAHCALVFVNAGLPQPDGVLFPDDDKISDYAKDAVYALKAVQIVSGRDNGSFDPRAYATREETAKIICGVMDAAAAAAA